MNPKVLAHTTYIGPTGYNNHSRDFFRHLSKHCKVKVNNFTIGNSWEGMSEEPHNNEDYINNTDKELLLNQWLWSGDKRNTYPIYSKHGDNFEPNIDIVLAGSSHHLFYDNYNNPSIAYNVWESTLQEQGFFNKLLEFDQIWVPSKWQAACTIKQGASVEQVKVVPEGVDIETFKPINKIKKSKFQFLIIGRWEYRKYTTEMIQSFNKVFKDIDGVELVLVVDNKYATDGMDSTEERLKHYNINTDKIKILSFLSRKDYVKLIQNTNVFLSCSRSEGWNLPLIEAMSCGIPSIYSNCSGQLQFAEGKGLPVNVVGEVKDNLGIGNYYEPNILHLERQILEVYKNYPRYFSKALKDSKIIHENFNWENIAQIGYNTIKDYMKFKNWDWGNTELSMKELLIKEFSGKSQYEDVFKVKENDIVVDIGASIGVFTNSIIGKKPNYVYCLEPSKNMFECLTNNLSNNKNITFINKGISHINKNNLSYGNSDNMKLYGGEKNMDGIKFSKFLNNHKIGFIDFLKLDCEGGEYQIFTDENIEYLLNNVGCIVGEWHLGEVDQKIDFRHFRDKYLKLFKTVEVFSVDGVNVKWDLYNDHFIEYYNNVIFHISNN